MQRTLSNKATPSRMMTHVTAYLGIPQIHFYGSKVLCNSLHNFAVLVPQSHSTDLSHICKKCKIQIVVYFSVGKNTKQK